MSIVRILALGTFWCVLTRELTLLNVNLPAIPPSDVRGVRVTSLGRRRYNESLTRAQDPRDFLVSSAPLFNDAHEYEGAIAVLVDFTDRNLL